MRRRLYFLFPDVESTRKTVDELLLARIDEGHIHVLAKDGIHLKDLPEASILQRSDIIHGVETGMIVGGLTGAVAGVIAWLLPSALTAGGLILGIALLGAVVGAWVSGMIGSSVRNSRLKPFEKAIDEGKVLLMVDTPKERVETIIDLVKKHHPECRAGGVEPTIPAFP